MWRKHLTEMNWWIIVPISLMLGWITIQDFRERRISLIALAVLFGLGLLNTCLTLQCHRLPYRVIGNSLFAGVILVSGTLLVKIRKRKDPVSSFIGSGDFLFLLSISPLFSFGSYLVFLNTSIILVLLSFGILLIKGRTKVSDTIPLAGALAICLIAFVTLDQFLPVNLFEDMGWIYAMKR